MYISEDDAEIDLNCDVTKASPDLHTQRLPFLCSLYPIDHLINEPTWVTATSTTLIDLILTNKARKHFSC